ncbi:hypothetical protein FACUT_9811 [Fusarium acutatum]|uniref:Uncharacterized protein n=1 Tax=Fusarium acutatum TaxID=78861 RepID=A0A8H4NGE7_9HYPO|nr:hypothetical protein FACUT_9811 [Fusarium acutatum]
MVETVISTGLIGSPEYGHGLALQSGPKANMKPLKQDYESSTPTIGYMDMATATGEMSFCRTSHVALDNPNGLRDGEWFGLVHEL